MDAQSLDIIRVLLDAEDALSKSNQQIQLAHKQESSWIASLAMRGRDLR